MMLCSIDIYLCAVFTYVKLFYFEYCLNAYKENMYIGVRLFVLVYVTDFNYHVLFIRFYIRKYGQKKN